MDIIEVIKQYGPWVALTVWMVYQNRRDHRRDYEGVCERLNQVEDWIKNQFLKELAKNTRALNHNAEIMKKCDSKNKDA